MSLYDNIKSHFILPNAYSDWKSYRNTLTSYLLDQTDSISLPLSFHTNMTTEEMLPTLAILGAGACNDLDLEKLSAHFSKITLIDYDTNALKQSLTTYHLSDSAVIELLPISLNGITDSDYHDFCEELQFYLREKEYNLTPESFEAFALSLLECCYQKKGQDAICLAPAAYDYIWCFGVHSQLQAMFSYIYHIFSVHLQNYFFPDKVLSETVFSNRLKEENSSFIPKFHDTLLSSARKAVYLGCEWRTLSTNEFPGTEKDDLLMNISKDISSTIDHQPIEGAYQAICDIRSRSLTLTEHTIIWPFYPAGNLAYEMLIQKIDL